MNKISLFLLICAPLYSFSMDRGDTPDKEKEDKKKFFVTPERASTAEKKFKRECNEKTREELNELTPLTKAAKTTARCSDKKPSCHRTLFALSELSKADQEDPRFSTTAEQVARIAISALPEYRVPLAQKDLFASERFEGKNAFDYPPGSAQSIFLTSALDPKSSPVRRLRRLAGSCSSISIAENFRCTINSNHLVHKKNGSGGHVIQNDAAFESLKCASIKNDITPLESSAGTLFIDDKTLFPRAWTLDTIVETLYQKYTNASVVAKSLVLNKDGKFIGDKVLYEFDEDFFVETLEIPTDNGVHIATAYPIFSLRRWVPENRMCIAHFTDLETLESIPVDADSSKIRDLIIAGARRDKNSVIMFEKHDSYICDIGPLLTRSFEDATITYDLRLPSKGIYIEISKEDLCI
jgi:hypothetical protein